MQIHLQVDRIDTDTQIMVAGPRVEATGAVKQALLARVAEQVGEGVAVFDRDGSMLYANPVLAALYGRPASELEGRHISTFRDQLGGDPEWTEVKGGGSGARRAEMSIMRSNGVQAHVEVSLAHLTDDDGVPIGEIACVRDVTAKRQLEAQLQRAALYDPLTDLPNRRLFTDRLDQALANAGRNDSSIAILFIDLDGFKKVNDDHGHGVGDALLVSASQRMRKCLREVDTLSRFGGDEFVALLADVSDADQPARIAARIVEAIEEPFECGASPINISASIGISMNGNVDLTGLVHAADLAMYEAKARGSGNIANAF
jgi:diguanylate cyclase (GGDEF)-like protein/PAS domain S-box-containing protein